MNTENLSTENKNEALNKHAVSCKRPYFKLSTNEFGKHWLFYKPSDEDGRYNCWMPIDDEFYKAFDEMQKAACASGAVAKGMSVCKDKTRRKDGPCKYKVGSCDDCQTP